jgi:Carbohydrate-selective porin, OprB family/S-layer homology domain
MSNMFLKSLLALPAALGLVAFAGSAIAAESISTEASVPEVSSLSGNEVISTQQPVAAPVEVAQAVQESADSLAQINQYGSEGAQAAAGQVTSVSQLSDVQPTDWAFQALQSLVERYGCIAGYPNGTYRGNRAMTRYEFAAGLNACMDRVNELIESATADLVRKEDLEALRKLQEEFAAELATLRGRVDALEARTSTLEAQQFSTTTKLQGEAIFALTGSSRNDQQVTFQNRVRLALNTSFNGKDLLVTRLASASAPQFDLPNSDNDTEGRQTFQLDTGNDIVLDWLAYYRPIGKKAQAYVAAVGGLHSDYVVTTANPYLEDFGGGSGALSFFAQDNSIYNIGGGTGVGLTYKVNDLVGVNVGYLAGGTDSAANPSEGQGLFNGSYAALAQVSLQPLKGKLKIAATYVNSYHTEGTPIYSYGGSTPVVGTDEGNFPYGEDARVRAHSGGLSVSYQFLPKLVASAWGSYTNAKEEGQPQSDIWSYAVALAFPDLGVKGNLGGLVLGAAPYLGNTREVQGGGDGTNDVPLHIEGFYKFQLNNYISVTPGIIYMLNPGQNDPDGFDKGAVIGTLRTTFKF